MRSSVLLGLTASLLLSPVASAQTSGVQSDTGRTVVYASGQSRQSAILDRASLILFIDAPGMTVDEAANRLSTVERGVLDTLRRFNLPAGSINTFAGGIAPYRPQTMPPSMMSGPSFAGRSSIRVEGLRPEQLAALTAAAMAKGATGVAPPSFTSSVADSVRRVLVPRAFDQAKREAELLAHAAGGQLGHLLTLNISPAQFDQQQPFVSQAYYESAPRVLPTTNTTVTVNASWMLIPGPRQ